MQDKLRLFRCGFDERCEALLAANYEEPRYALYRQKRRIGMAGTEVVRKRGRLSAGNCESSGSQAGSYAETQAGKGRRMQIPDLVLHGSSVFLHIV